jgi:hypothetical protein
MKTQQELETAFNNEFELLVRCSLICENAIKKYYDAQVTSYGNSKDRERMMEVIKRLFESELDYLQRNPRDYFEIYNDENWIL